MSADKVIPEIRTVQLPSPGPGTIRQLDFIHYGIPGTRPKAYLQAALHADEIPGLLVMHKLIGLLNAAGERGDISGHIILAPVANPIGSAQVLLGELSGRHDHANGVNFNRDYPDLSDEIALRLADKLGDDAVRNTQLIRQTALHILAETEWLDETWQLKAALIKNAIDADIVLDLHCDWQSVMHIYTATPIWPEARALAAYLGAQVSLLAEISGGNPFDEAVSGLWWALARRFPDKNIPNACIAATVELRGKADVSERLAEQDARALFHYLQWRGIIRGKAAELPMLLNPATPLDGVEKIVAPLAAVVSYNKKPGDRVFPGEVVCTLFDISHYEPAKVRIELCATIEGVMYSRRMDRLSRPGQVLCRIAGEHSIKNQRGPLLSN